MNLSGSSIYETKIHLHTYRYRYFGESTNTNSKTKKKEKTTTTNKCIPNGLSGSSAMHSNTNLRIVACIKHLLKISAYTEIYDEMLSILTVYSWEHF